MCSIGMWTSKTCSDWVDVVLWCGQGTVSGPQIVSEITTVVG